MPRIHKSQAQVYDTDADILGILDRAEEFGVWSHPIQGMNLELPREQYFANLDMIQKYVDKAQVMNSVRKLSEKPMPYITVKPSPYRDSAQASRSENKATIYIPDFDGGRRELRVVHELSHIVSHSSGHGEKFQDVYLDLIGQLIGPEIQLLYRMKLDEKKADPDSYVRVN